MREDQESHLTPMGIALACVFWFCLWMFAVGVFIHTVWFIRLIQLIPLEGLAKWLHIALPW